MAALLTILPRLCARAQTAPLTATVLDGSTNKGVPGASAYSKLSPQSFPLRAF